EPRWTFSRDTGTSVSLPPIGEMRAVTSVGAMGFCPRKIANATRVSPTANCGSDVIWTDNASDAADGDAFGVFFAHAQATAPRLRAPAARRNERRSSWS